MVTGGADLLRLLSFAIAMGFLVLNSSCRPALAASSTASFGVSATVQSACQAFAPAMAFGNYATAGGAPFSVACTNPTPYRVSLSADLTSPVNLKGAGGVKGFLDYKLLSASVNGSGPRGDWVMIPESGGGSAQAYAINRPTAHAWHVSSGAFADVVTVTITY